MRRGFPTDFPVVGFLRVVGRVLRRRGFPTDFPVVGLLRLPLCRAGAVASLPISLW